MKSKNNTNTIISAILVFALALRLFNNYILDTLSLETIILSALTIPILLVIYFAVFKVTNDKYSALFSLAILSVIPIEIFNYLWMISAIFFFLTLYSAILIKKNKKNWFLFLIFPFIAALTHYSAILLAPILVLYLVLLALEKDAIKKERVMFAALTSIITIIIVLTVNGIPMRGIMSGVSILTLFALVGTRPIVFGVAGAYHGVRNNISKSLVFVSAAAIIFSLLFLEMLTQTDGIPYLFISLAALSGIFYKEVMKIVKISKVKKHYNIIRIIFFLFVLATGLIHWI